VALLIGDLGLLSRSARLETLGLVGGSMIFICSPLETTGKKVSHL